MQLLLDTDICVELLRNNTHVVKSVKKVKQSDLCLSFMTVVELMFGAHHSKLEKQVEITRKFVSQFVFLHSDIISCNYFGMMKSNLKNNGKIIGDADLLIASIALANKCELVTNNRKHFDRLLEFGLKVVSW